MMSKQLVMARVLKKDHEANLQITKQFVSEYNVFNSKE